MEQTFREVHLNYLDWFFGSDYRRWEAANLHDMRRIYVNMFDMIHDALMELPEEPTPWTAVAISEAMQKDYEEMRDIQRKFRDVPLPDPDACEHCASPSPFNCSNCGCGR